MNIILIIAGIGLITGLFTLFSINIVDFTTDIFQKIMAEPDTLKFQVKKSNGKRKLGFFKREIKESIDILKLSKKDKSFPLICLSSLILFTVGASISIMFDNIFSIPILAVGFMFIPFWYIRLSQSHFKKEISAQIETTLSVITTSYIRSEDIVTAIEENIPYLNYSIATVFKGFLYKVKMVNPDIVSALREMRDKVDNAIFKEWCDAMISCQYDRSLKTVLTPIVSKLSDMRLVNGELENLIFEPRKEFITMQILMLLNIPLLYFLNKDWYNVLMHSTPGQIVLSVCFAVMFISMGFVVKLTQPIEYKR